MTGRAETADLPGDATSVTQPVPAAPSRSAPVARTFGILAAAALVGVGVVLAHEALASARGGGLAPDEGWLRATLALADGLPATIWGPVGAATVAVGAAVLVGTWLPAVRTARVAAAPAAELAPQDVSSLAASAAADVDGVLDAVASATRRAVVVRATTTGAARTPDEIGEAVRARLSVLDRAPRVRVRASARKGDE